MTDFPASTQLTVLSLGRRTNPITSSLFKASPNEHLHRRSDKVWNIMHSNATLTQAKQNNIRKIFC